MFTYGDGVADIDINALLKFHHSHGKLATVTTVRFPERFGRIILEGDQVVEFFEKPQTSAGWINGGFFVLNAKAIDYVEVTRRSGSVIRLNDWLVMAQVMGYRHYGFWSCMDTLREKNYLEELWASGKPPWKIW